MNDQERIKELEYLNNEHRGVISILMDEREVLREKIAELEKQSYRQNHEGFSTIIDKTTPQTKPLSDEEIRYLVPWQVWRELPMEIKKGLVRAIEAKVRGEK